MSVKKHIENQLYLESQQAYIAQNSYKKSSHRKLIFDYPFSPKNIIPELLKIHSVNDITTKIGISKKTYYKWLHGDISKPRLKHFFKLIVLYCRLIENHNDQ